ncbi:MAG: hypothetical protein ACKVJS_03000 [Flavobacteriales bacterium]|jgi:hypothetical protein|tara:strand:- start:1761 stop:2438 length:678 start_codon:yes stop_codon:yes gene_type:complete
MKKNYLYFSFLFFVIIGYSQAFDTNQYNLTSQFQTILKEISLGKSKVPLEIDGSTYFFKKPQDAIIVLNDGKNPIKIKTNYNLLNETFEVKSEDGLLNLAPNKINSIRFNEYSFIVFDSKFYQLITKNDKFSILKSYNLVAIEPDYQPGIQDKPNLRYKKVNNLFIENNGKLSQIKGAKNAIVALFGKNNTKAVKTFIKKNKISVRDTNDLKLLFDNYKDILPTN